MSIASEVSKRRKSSRQRTTIDLSNIDTLKDYAESKGLDVREKKPSIFVRAMDWMSRPIYASAGAAKALVKGNENPLGEAWKGLKGEEKETYSDVLKEAGVENKIARAVVGFGLDVALDPSTYMGGWLIKGALKSSKLVGKTALGTTRLVNPRLASALEVTGKSLKDALGVAFNPAHNLSKTKSGMTLADDINQYWNKLGMKTDETVDTINKSFETLPREQHKEFARTLLDFRKQLPEMEKKLSKRTKEVILPDETKIGANITTAKKEGKSFDEFMESHGVQRIEEPGVKISFDKPQGLYTTPAKFESPHNYLGGETNLFGINPDSKIITIEHSGKLNLSGRGVDQDAANLMWLRQELPDVADNIRGKSFPELKIQFLKEFPNTKWDKYTEIQDMVEGYAGLKARQNGIDVIKTIDKTNPEFSETVLLNKDKILTKSKLKQLWDKQLSKQLPPQGTRATAKKTLNELTPEFKTPEQLNFFNKTYKGIVDDMAKSAGLPEAERFKAYFPSIDVERLKPALGGRAASVTDKSYLNLYKGAVEKELDKPIEALTRTQMKIFRDKTAEGTLKHAVDTYGVSKEAFKKLPKEEQALYKMIKDKQFGKEVGYLKEADFSFINNSLYPEMKVFDLLAKASGFDFSNRIFKTAVTTYFPAFHIRNSISGGIQNYEVFGAAAFAPDVMPLIGKSGLSIMKGADKEIKLGKRIFNSKELKKVLDENFGGTSRYIADLGDHIDDLSKGNYKKLSKMNPRRIGDFIETNQKANAMAMALKKGKSLDEAVKLAEKAGFNYQKLTQFESKVMRRAIPFYSFMRKNAELQVKTLINNPERILNQAKFAKGLSNLFGEKMTEEDLEGVPPWAIEGLGFKIKDDKYVASLGIPMEEFFSRVNNPLMSTLSSLSPVIKYNLEAKLGYDFFRERKIIDLNKISPTSGEILMKAQESGKMPTWLSQAINIKSYVNNEGKTQYTMSPKALHRLRNLPTSRFENTFEKIFDKDLDTANKMAALFTGGKIYDIDTEKQKYFTERDMRRDMEDQLMNIGEGDKHESFYIRK